ncbi:hypothetical protein D1007_41433 [Hordeum vulgare]|nr:hypothetical protein D1007_41433 [Hordeum vulgare]
MAPAGKQKPEAQGPAPAPPLLECALSKDADLVHALPWTATGTDEHGWTPIWMGAIEEQPRFVYPFFLHNVFSGLVPPFSPFFTAILNHYGVQALDLHPNFVLLLSAFAFYCKAFMGVRPSVALFRQFFSLSCMTAPIRRHASPSWRLRAATCSWRPGIRPLWDYHAGDDELRLWFQDLPIEELRRVLAILLVGDPGDLPEALGLLYHLDDRADTIAGLPVFDERGLVPA